MWGVTCRRLWLKRCVGVAVWRVGCFSAAASAPQRWGVGVSAMGRRRLSDGASASQRVGGSVLRRRRPKFAESVSDAQDPGEQPLAERGRCQQRNLGTESVTNEKKDWRGKTVARLGETSWQHGWSLERNLLIGVQLSW